MFILANVVFVVAIAATVAALVVELTGGPR